MTFVVDAGIMLTVSNCVPHCQKKFSSRHINLSNKKLLSHREGGRLFHLVDRRIHNFARKC